MVKEGSERTEKFEAKHDPKVLLLRWKALKDFSLKKFYVAVIRHEILDLSIQRLVEEYNLDYGQAGRYTDKIRRIIYDWGIITESQKQFLRQEWIDEGLPEELFDKIAAKYDEFMSYSAQLETKNIVLIWQIEVSPPLEESVFPVEEDYVTETEVTIEKEVIPPSVVSFQEGVGYGSFFPSLMRFALTPTVTLICTLETIVTLAPLIEVSVIIVLTYSLTTDSSDETTNIILFYETEVYMPYWTLGTSKLGIDTRLA